MNESPVLDSFLMVIIFLDVALIVALFLSGMLRVCPPVAIAAGLAKTRQK